MVAAMQAVEVVDCVQLDNFYLRCMIVSICRGLVTVRAHFIESGAQGTIV